MAKGNPSSNNILTLNGKQLKAIPAEQCLEMLVDILGADTCVTLLNSAICRTVDQFSEQVQKRVKSSLSPVALVTEVTREESLASPKVLRPPPISTPLTKEDVVDLLRDNPGWHTSDQIAKKLNCSAQAVGQIIRRSAYLFNKRDQEEPYHYELAHEKT
jgi:hypothetical protein